MQPTRVDTDATPGATVAAEVGRALVANVERVVLGKSDAIGLVVAALLGRGHVLVDDAPGMGKTLLAKALARSIGGSAGRVQGTVDLLPADITGVSVFDPESRRWDFRPGPVFNNVLLFDEINRATPRAQSALLEAMAEHHVTVDGTVHELPDPFFVIATQNPLGDVGTFPLVAGEYDRFAISISLGLPDREAERALLRREGGQTALDDLAPVVDGTALDAAFAEVERLHTSPAVEDYVLDLAAATRQHASLSRGLSPRGTQMLLRVAQGRAAIEGRGFVTPDDVQAVAPAVLTHRVTEPSQATARNSVDELLRSVPVPPP